MIQYKPPKYRCGKCVDFPGHGKVCPLNTWIVDSLRPVKYWDYACSRFR